MRLKGLLARSEETLNKLNKEKYILNSSLKRVEVVYGRLWEMVQGEAYGTVSNLTNAIFQWPDAFQSFCFLFNFFTSMLHSLFFILFTSIFILRDFLIKKTDKKTDRRN